MQKAHELTLKILEVTQFIFVGAGHYVTPNQVILSADLD